MAAFDLLKHRLRRRILKLPTHCAHKALAMEDGPRRTTGFFERQALWLYSEILSDGSPMSADECPPPPAGTGDLTTLLHAWHQGDSTAFSAAVDRVYLDLKRIAAQRLGRGAAATFSPTELVHEAVLDMLPARMDFANRTHFLATMSLAMRAILVDHARARSAEKRGGDRVQVSISRIDEESPGNAAPIDLLALEQALQGLEALDPRCGRAMHLTYFGGLSQDEIASLLGVSVPTVKRDLRFARAWLLKAIGEDQVSPESSDAG